MNSNPSKGKQHTKSRSPLRAWLGLAIILDIIFLFQDPLDYFFNIIAKDPTSYYNIG